MAKEKKGQKFGRNKRAATHAMQTQRTAKNKRLNTEREVKTQGKNAVKFDQLDKRGNPKKTPHGTARAKRRANIRPQIAA